MSDSLNRDVAIFSEAYGLEGSERARFLDRACAGDLALRFRVEALLRAHEDAAGFLEEAPGNSFLGRSLAVSIGETVGMRIGRYKLLEQIGEGGHGVVFMAEQEAPVRRRVALKVIKPGMDTKSVIARFEAERQALAMMDHPNIAKVFDAGATESGRPYFVMELVRGIKITEYCDENLLTTEERLTLFTQVCQAIQHAHQKGIIHRDIKPSNILVTTTEQGTALPVVIDFGIAKATNDQRLTDKTLFTAFEMLIGTPAYMSPEQAAFTNADVDTRTDIYSLGVLLYELLTGSTPFDPNELLKGGLDEIRRRVREEQPVRPSTRLGKLSKPDLTTVAGRRKSEPPRLIRAVSGDLDWISMKALEKDRTRRYPTVNGLALDVQRFLAHEAISARPPSAFYWLGRTARRHKFLFIGVATIASLLVFSLIVVSTSLGRERQARFKAQTEQARSRQVTQFLEDMLQGVGPSVARGRDTTMLREILDRTAERLGGLTNQPDVEVELRGVIGRLYQELGSYERAEAMHLAAVSLQRTLSGPASREVADALGDLGDAFWKQRNLAEAEAAYSESLALRRRLFGNNHSDVAKTLNSLGAVYRRQRKLAESEALTREGLAVRLRLYGSEHLDVADSLRNLCIILGDRGKMAEAESTAREMLEMRRRLLGNDHPLVASALSDLAWAAGYVGKSTEAELLESEALVIQQKYLGDEHPDVAKSISSLGGRMRKRGSLTESHAVLNAALSIQRRLLGEDHPDSLETLRSLGLTLEKENNWADAEVLYREGLTLWRKRAGDEDPRTLVAWEDLIRALRALKRVAEAEQIAREVLTPAFVQKKSSANLLSLRADLLSRQGRWEEASVDAMLAVEHLPEEHYRYHVLAPLLVMTRNRIAYDQLCQRILSKFTNTSDPYIAERVSKDCLLWPATGIDLGAVDKLADVAVTRGTGRSSLPFFQVSKALSTYRQGRFAEARNWAELALAGSPVYARAHASAVLAMAQWQVGQRDEARATLAKGDALAPGIRFESNVDVLGNDWVAWLFARITLDEAAHLIQPVAANGSSSESR